MPGLQDRAFLSSIAFLDQRDILDKVLDIYDEEKTILDIMDMTGRTYSAVQPEFHNFVNDWLYRVAAQSAVAASIITVNTFETLIITVATADEVPLVGEVGMDVETGEMFVVIARDVADPFTFTTKALTAGAGVLFAGSLPASGAKFTFFSNAHGEGTGSELMRRTQLIKEQNNIQIFKTKYGVTDLGRGSQIEVEFKGKPYYFLKQQHDAYLKHRMDVMFAFLLGQQGQTEDVNGNLVYTTRGIDHYVTDQGGIAQAVAVPGTLDREDMRVMSRTMDKARCPNEYFLWTGGAIDTQYDDVIGGFSELVNGGIQYNAFGRANPKQKAIDLGINSFRIYGRTYHKKRLPALDHQKVTAVSGSSLYPGYAYMLPTNKIKVDTGSDGAGMVDRIATRFLEFEDGSNTRYREKLLGGLAPTPTDDRDVLEVVYTSIEGLMCVGTQHFTRLDLADPTSYI
jgi:hypothetical protein